MLKKLNTGLIIDHKRNGSNFRKFWADFRNNHSEYELNIFKRLIDENDVDIYNWIIGVSNTPEIYSIMIDKIRSVVGFKVK